ncbi:MAG: helix-turn-helix transcriptional regulator [Gammaproteobacteria bacterium]|nr:transcriptional regulator [Gammaproteobacteria bacterium]MYF31236.1 helix-turn-helix transcriptional regulator [Gammaproteobacteria bacterium]MYK45179.1 helix-turn-helix transcriptional regulator [Gammaproteobacteria bacterium]
MSVDEVGKTVRSTRRSLGVTQRELAMAAGTGLRFVIDLEKGKATCELGKTLAVLSTLGVEVAFEKRDARGA